MSMEKEKKIKEKDKEKEKDKLKVKEKEKAPKGNKTPRQAGKDDFKEEKKIPKTVPDKGSLFDFLQKISEWHKFANGKSDSEGDLRSYSESTGQTIKHFVLKSNFPLPKPENEITISQYVQFAIQMAIEEHQKTDQLHSQYQKIMNFESVTTILKLFIQNFVKVFQKISSGDFTTENEVMDQDIRHVLQEYEDSLGWTLDEEMDIYRSLPIRGEFPPSDYRVPNFEELEAKLIPECARPANHRLFSFSGLLERLEGELSFRTSAINIRDVDPATLSFGSSQEALNNHMATEFSKIYSTEWRSGNLYTAIRAALCFLLQSQTTLDILSPLPLFRVLLQPPKPPQIESRHLVDLPKNLRIASVYQSPKPSLVDRKRNTFEEGKTIADVFKGIESRSDAGLRVHPRTDLVHVLVGMFFDEPYTNFRAHFENDLKHYTILENQFFSSFVNFSPLLIHHDIEFLADYFVRNPAGDYSQTFLLPSLKNKDLNPATVPPSTSFLRKVGEDLSETAEVINKLETVPLSEKADLLSTVFRQSSGPDVPPNLDDLSEINEYELKFLNYANKRNISTGIFEMFRNTVKSIKSYSHTFNQYSEKKLVEELTERLTSLFLGYAHAFTAKQRPHDRPFLDIEIIIPFLYRHKLSFGEPSKHKTSILGVEGEFYKSPLVYAILKHFVQFSKEKPQSYADPKTPQFPNTKPLKPTQPSEVPSLNQTQEQMIFLINSLYALWEESKLSADAAHELNLLIIKIISNSRYDLDQLKDTLKVQIEKSKEEVTFWSTSLRNLQAYGTFLSKYDKILQDGSHPLADSLCPSNFVVDVNLTEDQQLVDIL